MIEKFFFFPLFKFTNFSKWNKNGISNTEDCKSSVYEISLFFYLFNTFLLITWILLFINLF